MIQDLQTYEQGDDVVIVLTDDHCDGGVYRSLSRAMDYIADWTTAANTGEGVSDEVYANARAKVREKMEARETTYGWVIECEGLSYKALKSALRC